jgi:hypothetical protein
MAEACLFTVRNTADDDVDGPTTSEIDRGGTRSRFALYLGYHAHLFHTGDHQTTDRAAFALAAFMVATAPIMERPYIARHDRVLRTRPRRDNAGRRQLTIDIATPTPADLTIRIPFEARGWERAATHEFTPPAACDEPAAYTQLTIGLPIPIDLLPDPSYEDGRAPRVSTARQAVRVLANYANVVCGDLLGSLDD